MGASAGMRKCAGKDRLNRESNDCAHSRTFRKAEQMDRTTKFLMAAIAAGLFANAGANLMRPAWAQAPSMTDTVITGYLHSISQAMTDIAGGTCGNIKICEK
jgi:hypothetical protein